MVRIASLALALVCISSVASADAPLIGAWFGPRIFADNSTLGYINDAAQHPMLETSIELGARLSHEFIVPWLFPELELGFSPTHTTMVPGAAQVSVAWLDPRFNLRFEVLRHGKLRPFVLIGGGSPIALSSARMTYNSGIVGDGYGGVGVRYDTGRGFLLRFDARLAIGPGIDLATGDNRPAFEGEFGFGVEIDLNHKGGAGAQRKAPTDNTDTDGDGIPDSRDKCPDRPEDFDNFEDADGCPDIDNDGDHILDIADKCPNVPETYNGYEDEDGCPDTVPADVSGIVGTIEGLIYAEAETAVRDSALPTIAKIATVLKAHPGVRVVIVGHTDDREAKVFAMKPAEGEPEPDIAAIAADLSHGRAEAVKQVLVNDGIPEGRIVVDGEGAEDPVMDNATAKGRFANRRVSIKLFVPAH